MTSRRPYRNKSILETLGPSLVVVRLNAAVLDIRDIPAELARVSAERDRLQRQAQKERSRRKKQREHAILTATIASCHEPTTEPTIAEATLRRYARAMDEQVADLTHEIETRFLRTPAETLAQWLDWSEDIPRTVRAEAQRLVEDARLLRWIGEQNCAQGVVPPPNSYGKNGARWPSITTTARGKALPCGDQLAVLQRRNGCNDFDSAGI